MSTAQAHSHSVSVISYTYILKKKMYTGVFKVQDNLFGVFTHQSSHFAVMKRQGYLKCILYSYYVSLYISNSCHRFITEAQLNI